MRTRFSYLAYTMLKTGSTYHELGGSVLWDNARRQQVVAAHALRPGQVTRQKDCFTNPAGSLWRGCRSEAARDGQQQQERVEVAVALDSAR
jgi:hypothetical protein